MEIQKPERPLIDRPRYVSKPPNVVNVKPNNNKTVNKKNPNKQQQKRKVVNKEILKLKDENLDVFMDRFYFSK